MTSEEVELKFVYDDGDAVVGWLDDNFPPAADQSWRTLEITDRYFDTPDQALAAAGYGARLRTIGSETLLTVKADIEVSAGLHRRLELEAPATRSLKPQKWPESEARSRLLDVIGDRRLVESFVVGQQRREREIIVPGALAVASIDQGEVEFLALHAGDIHQFEVELRDGNLEALRVLAGKVVDARIGRPEERSKLVMAAALAEEAARLHADDCWSDAARKRLRAHLIRMLERESATRAGDPLALKQMRVATRRMRATWRVFAGAFSGGRARRFNERLRHVAGLLGAVRDLDVLLESVARRDELGALAASWRVRRDIAFAELVEHLDSDRYDRFVDAFLDGTAARAQWAVGKDANEAVADLAPRRLEHGREKLVEAAHAAAVSNDATAWHSLRIAAKRMRYSLEAFREILDPQPTTAFIESLRTAQDVLGEMNDASVAAREGALWLTSSTASDVAPDQRVAVARFIGQREKDVASTRESFAPLVAALVSIEVPGIN